MDIHHPHDILNLWLAEEKQKGAPNPQQAILSTGAIPHSRVVAIREITPDILGAVDNSHRQPQVTACMVALACSYRRVHEHDLTYKTG